MMNRATERIFGWILGDRTENPNIMRSVFDDDGLRPFIVNWDEVALDMLQHLHVQASSTPNDPVLNALRAEILASPNAPSRASDVSSSAPLLTATYERDGKRVSFFATLSTFGTPYDVTLEQLHIECSFPADTATEEFCRELAAKNP